MSLATLRIATLRLRLDLAATARDAFLLPALVIYPAVLLLSEGENVLLLASSPTAAAAFVVGIFVIVQVGRERFDGTLMRLRALPAGLPAYVAGRVASYLVLMLLTAALTLAVAFRGAIEPPSAAGAWALVLAGVVLGAVAFSALAIAMTAALPSASPTGGASVVAQMVVVAVVLASSNLVPIEDMPAALRWIVLALPVFWGGHLVRAGLLDERYAAAEPTDAFVPGLALAVLVLWSAVGGLLAVRALGRSARRPDS